MRWDKNYSQPEVINDPAIIPAYGVTDVERAYWNAKQEALEYDRYPTLRSDKHCTSGVIHRALEDYKTSAVELSQAFFWGQVGGLAQTKEACEAAANDAAASALNASQSASDAATIKNEVASYVDVVSNYATAALNYSTNSYNSSLNAASSANTAAQESLKAQNFSQDSEAWAVGERGGYPVSSDDPTYHNNAKYYVDEIFIELDNKVDKVAGKGLSTNDYTDADKAIVDGVTPALNNKLDTSLKGAANGVAELDNAGKVPSAQLPSYVDDVVEYASKSMFPAVGETGKIYVAFDTNRQYRWSGTQYVEVSESLALGETSSTAYAGNKGKANADAIVAIKNGSSIDSFGDVETSLTTKVDKVTGKGLSTNDYDNTAKNIVDGVTAALANKVDKVTGKGLSTNDYTDADKTKLNGIAAGAEVNVQSDWNVTDTTSDAFIKNKPTIPAAQVNSDWNATSGKAQILNKPTIPDTANCYQTGDTAETALADGDYFPFYDTSATAKRKTLWSNIKSVLKTYFDTLYSTVKSRGTPTSGGTALSLVNTGDMYTWNNKTNTSVKGNAESSYRTGQVNITPANVGLGNVGNFKAVSTVGSQGLTDTEKANARANIGAGTSSFSGSYDDLSNKPTIPAAQVNSDWNATSGKAQILNKPTIPSVTINSTGTASSSSVKYQRIGINAVYTEIDGTKYMEASTYTTPSTGTRRFTFTGDAIQSTSVFDFYCNVFNVAPIAITLDTTSTTHLLAVDFNASDNVTTCRIYIRG